MVEIGTVIGVATIGVAEISTVIGVATIGMAEISIAIVVIMSEEVIDTIVAEQEVAIGIER